MKQLWVLLLVWTFAQPVFATPPDVLEIDAVALANAKASITHLDLDRLVQLSPKAIELSIQALESPASLLLTGELLRKLGRQQQETSAQREWVLGLLNNAGKLTTANPDHPHQKIMLVDPAQQAQTVLTLWQVRDQVSLLEQRWQAGNWFWPDLYHLEMTGRMALARWLDAAPIDRAEQLAALYLQQVENAEWPDNEVLATLALKSKAPEIWAQIWSEPADQHTYQLLQALPSVLPQHQAIEQIGLAMTNGKTASQALMTLANHFGDQPEVERIWNRAFSHPEQKWYAAAAIGKVNDQKLLSKLQPTIDKLEPKAAQLVLMSKQKGAQR